jgi:hypothetical protein
MLILNEVLPLLDNARSSLFSKKIQLTVETGTPSSFELILYRCSAKGLNTMQQQLHF